MSDIAFPVYVVCKDCKDIDAFASYQVMRGYLEAIDVENEEYEAFDANGFRLVLGVGKPKETWLKIEVTQTRLPESEFAAVKATAREYKEPEPIMRALWRKLGLAKS